MTERPWVTWGLAATCLFVALFIVGPLPSSDRLAQVAWSSEAAAAGQWQMILTSMFVHAGPIHLAMNVLLLLPLGALVEHNLGRWRYLTLYFGAGIGAAFLHLALVGGPAVGASGAIFGLVGYMLIQHPRADLRLFFIPVPLVYTAAFYTALVFLVPSFAGVLRIAHAAHVGGMLVGVGIGAYFDPRLSIHHAPGVAGFFVAAMMLVGWWVLSPHVPSSDVFADSGWAGLLSAKWPVLASAVIAGVSIVHLNKTEEFIEPIRRGQVKGASYLPPFTCTNAACGSQRQEVLRWEQFWGKSLRTRCLDCKMEHEWETGRRFHAQCLNCGAVTERFAWANETVANECEKCRAITDYDFNDWPVQKLQCDTCKQVFAVNGRRDEAISARCIYCWRSATWS